MLPGVWNQAIRDPGDVDDCWCLALDWAARAARASARFFSIDEVRAAAGDPDDGIRDGGSLDESCLAARTLWPDLPATRYVGDWDTFARLVREGRTGSLAVSSWHLPAALRFGFTGAHQVGVGFEFGAFRVANPLAPEGSAPLAITEADLRAAATGLYAGGEVRAVLFVREEIAMQQVTLEPFAAPRTFRVAAGATVRGYDPARPGGPVKSITAAAPSSAKADAIATVLYPGEAHPPVPRGGPFLRVSTGALAGLLIVAAAVTLDPAPPAIDRVRLEEAIAELRAAVGL